MKLCSLVPVFYIHLYVSDLYIPRIGLPICLQQNRQTDPRNILIAHRYMNEAAQFSGNAWIGTRHLYGILSGPSCAVCMVIGLFIFSHFWNFSKKECKIFAPVKYCADYFQQRGQFWSINISNSPPCFTRNASCVLLVPPCVLFRRTRICVYWWAFFKLLLLWVHLVCVYFVHMSFASLLLTSH